MPGLIDKRKRSREDDVLCESTPLSKRINNLHLSNFEEAQYNQQSFSYHINNNQLGKDVMAPAGDTTTQKHMQSYEPEKNFYDPELNESQNPFYYLKNKLLYDLHVERLKRCSV